VLACRADWLLYQGRFEDAYQLTNMLLGQDPYASQALTTHLAAALQLGKKNELFLRYSLQMGVWWEGVSQEGGQGENGS
jgi:anaphase-promoting complex subunit 6